jgi:hypothetical protein
LLRVDLPPPALPNTATFFIATTLSNKYLKRLPLSAAFVTLNQSFEPTLKVPRRNFKILKSNLLCLLLEQLKHHAPKPAGILQPIAFLRYFTTQTMWALSL